MATRLLSFQQLVQEADPDWQRARLRPWIYDFSNGRRFVSPPDPYADPLVDGSGQRITDGSGQVITTS